jgi:hypothetical protein
MVTLIIYYAIAQGAYKDVLRISGISNEEAVSRWLADQVQNFQYTSIAVTEVFEISKKSHQYWDSTGITLEFNSN